MVEIPTQQICLPWYLCPRISICLPWYPCPRISFCMVNKLWFTSYQILKQKHQTADLSQESLHFLSCLSSLLCFTRMIIFTNKKLWLQLNYDSKELITSLCLNWEKSVWFFYGCVFIIIIMVFPFSFHRPNTLCPKPLSDSMRIRIGEILNYTTILRSLVEELTCFWKKNLHLQVCGTYCLCHHMTENFQD